MLAIFISLYLFVLITGCCIFHKRRGFAESDSDESDSDAEQAEADEQKAAAASNKPKNYQRHHA